MGTWDILHVNSLEVEHGVPERELLDALATGRLSRDDCVRRPGDDRWWRIYEVDELRRSVGAVEAADEPPVLREGSLRDLLAEAEPPQTAAPPRPRPLPPRSPAAPAPTTAITLQAPSPAEIPPAPIAPAEEEESLPFLRRKHKEQEELDMTPMVDVAMQLILFFMVTSSIVMQLCMEFPKPAPDETGRPQVAPTIRTLDDLRSDHIMVRIKADNSIYIDEDKQPTKDSELKDKLEQIRRERAPNGGMVVSSEENAYHETVVKVVDAANQASIAPIKMANPTKPAKKAAAKKRAIK